MNFWITFFLIVVVTGLISKYFRIENSWLLIICILLGVLYIFREVTVGTDTLNYTYAYNVIKHGGNIPKNHIASSSEAFLFALKIFSFLPDNIGYCCITSIPLIGGLFCIIKKHSEDYFLSIILFILSYMCCYSMNAARQFMAIGLLLFCFVLAEDKFYIISLIIFVLAVSIHNSAIMFLVYYFFRVVKWNWKRMFIYMILTLSTINMVPIFLNLFIKMFPHYYTLSTLLYSDKYKSEGRSSLVYAICCLTFIIIDTLIILSKKNVIRITSNKVNIIETKNDNNTIQMRFEMLGIMFTCMIILLFFRYNILITRMAYVLFMFFFIAIPNAIVHLKRFRFVTEMGIVIGLALFSMMMLSHNYSNVLNYKFCFT